MRESWVERRGRHHINYFFNIILWYSDKHFFKAILIFRHGILQFKIKMLIVNIPGPRNWHPLVLTAAHRFADSWCGYWCRTRSSETIRSPRDRAIRVARDLPSSSKSWQWIRLISFLCIGRLKTHLDMLLLLLPLVFWAVWLLLLDGLCSLQVELSSSDASADKGKD